MRTMEVWHRRGGDVTVRPDELTYGSVLNALSKCGGGEKAAVEAEGILRGVVDDDGRYGDDDGYGGGGVVGGGVGPNTVMYNAAISAWANSGCEDAPARAEALLREMQERRRRTAAAAPSSSRWRNSDDDEYDDDEEGCDPDARTYSAVITSYARSDRKDSAVRAESLLNEMEESTLTVVPDAVVYNSVANAWSKMAERSSYGGGGEAVDAVGNAERILMIRSPYDPDNYAVNSILDANARAGGGLDSQRRAMKILTWMKGEGTYGGHDHVVEEGGSGKLYRGSGPDAYAYSAAIRAVSTAPAKDGGDKSDAVTYVLNLLEEAKEAGAASVEVYNVALDALGKISTAASSAELIQGILIDMEEKKLMTTTKTWPNRIT